MDQVALIREKINLVELIGESVKLKKAGRNFRGLCPFHSEKSPSFTVSPERQIWHCFGCGKGGDCYTFLMELDRVEFFEALRTLAQRAGVKLETKAPSPKSALKGRLLEIHHLAAEYYHYLLNNHPLGQRGREYLETRGVNEKVMKTFFLGFAPDSWDNLVKFLRKKGYNDEEIEKSGLGIRGKSGLYDRFRDRLTFPIKNYRGEVIAFSGRVLTKDAKEVKYINSPETLLYSKGETLFGLDITKEAIRKENCAIIAEGEFDVISSFQTGVSNIVAIKGSALSEMQIQLLKRFTDRLLLALDQDAAGDAAMRRGIEVAEKVGMDVKVIVVPGGKDPDEAARSAPLEWKKAVAGSIPIYDFWMLSAAKRFDTKDAYGKRKISEEILPILRNIENAIIQAHYVKKFAKLLNTSEESVQRAINKLPRVARKVAKEDVKPTPPVAETQPLLEEYLLSLIIQAPNYKSWVETVGEALDPADFESVVLGKVLMALIDYLSSDEVGDINDFAKELPAELVPAFDRVYLKDLGITAENSEKDFKKTLKLVKKQILRRKIKDLTTQITSAESDEHKSELHGQLVNFTAALKQLS